MSTLNTRGTRILTQSGPVAAEELERGMMILSPDGRTYPVTRTFTAYVNSVRVIPLRGLPFTVPKDEVFPMETFRSRRALWREYAEEDVLRIPLPVLSAAGPYRRRTLFFLRGRTTCEGIPAIRDFMIYGIRKHHAPTALSTRLIAGADTPQRAYSVMRCLTAAGLCAWVHDGTHSLCGGESILLVRGEMKRWCVEARGDLTPVFGKEQLEDIVLNGPKEDNAKYAKTPALSAVAAGMQCFFGFSVPSPVPYMTEDLTVRSTC